MESVSVLVLTKNGSAYIRPLLEAVYSQQGIRSQEVIVLDSGSSDSTIELARKFPVRIEHIPAQEFHHARTRNLAASMASGKILVFLSQDAIPASDTWLSTLVRNFDDPRVGAVYGRQIPKADASIERHEVFDALYGNERIVKDPRSENRLGYRFYHFSNVNAALRGTLWRATGFPEELKVFEDLGIAKRILDYGWKIVYEPAAPVIHSHKHSAIDLFKRYFDIGYTLRHLQIWESPGVASSMLVDARKLFSRKPSKPSAPGRRSSRNLSQTIAKAFGLALGLNQQYLPLMVKKHLTAHRIYQDLPVS
jgi:rhamnosyltransferase